MIIVSYQKEKEKQKQKIYFLKNYFLSHLVGLSGTGIGILG